MTPGDRDMIGYGRRPPAACWPGNARVALQIVVNYEEGGERSPLDGDDGPEAYLADVGATSPFVGGRDPSVESTYEYGSRVGFWRLYRLLTTRAVPVTVFGVATALSRNPEAVAAMREADWEIACHGLRWLDYRAIDVETERAHLREAVALHTRVTGSRPLGWYTGRASIHTRELVIEEGGFLYDADSYADELPYWVATRGRAHLVIPYTLDQNDMRFALSPGFSDARDFHAYLRDAFDVLWAEGATAPRLMSIGLHGRLAGRPGRVPGLARFLDEVLVKDGVWLCRRVDVARHWQTAHPPR